MLMISSFLDEIKKQLQTDFRYVPEYMVHECFISMLVLKYYCDNSKYSYKELINNNQIDDIYFPIDDLEIKIGVVKYTKLLSFIQYSSLQDLVKEYLNNRSFDIDFINNDKSKICITTNLVKELYDFCGNTIYVIDKLNLSSYEVALFKFFDKVLGINNKYLKYEDAIKEENNYIYVYDNTPRYRFIRNSNNDVYDVVKKLLVHNSVFEVLLHTDFKKVSNMKELRFLINSLAKVILYDNKNTFLYFKRRDNKQVSIIDYNKDKVKSIEHFYKIINNDRKQKDILVKTTADEIKDNYYRLGFKLYQNKAVEDVRNINEIVDENTRLIDKLSRINSDIEQEINNLINR